MPFLFYLVTAFFGLAAGLAATLAVTRSGASPFASHVGPWEFSPRAGAPDNDPYSRAKQFAEGEWPLAAGEGYSLRATTDRSGAPLESRCRYRLESPFPAARYWTVTLTDPRGRLVANLAERHGFTSAEIIRGHDGAFSIVIGPDPMAGNWLPSGRAGGGFILTLRFYETPLSATATELDPRSLPALGKLDCP